MSLDDKVSTWLPDIPHADEVTLGQLAQMTSGYADYVIGNTEFDAAHLRRSVPQVDARGAARLRASTKPLLYAPGTNWNYAHTNYVILGLALEKITGQPMTRADAGEGARAAGADEHHRLRAPRPSPSPCCTPSAPNAARPCGSRRARPFYEESTFWNPSWTITHGAIQTTNIYDLHATAVAIGTGKLLSPESYQAMMSTDLRGKTTARAGVHHLLRAERRLHLRARHRHHRRLADAEPVVPG